MHLRAQWFRTMAVIRRERIFDKADEETMPKGPVTHEELHEFAAQMVDRAVAHFPGARERLRHRMKQGVVMTTSYSGLGTVEAMGPVIKSICVKKGLCEEADVGVTVHSSADISKLCQKMVSLHKPASLAQHRRGDLLDAAAEKTVQHLDGACTQEI